jgi:GntR family transcriptional repressor for pyruvate dehydrogenase complex
MGPAVEPTSRTRPDSTEHVITHIRDRIARRELRPGDRLPPERDLAVQLGVSRPTVRAGLRALAAMGVIESRHGSGTYIPDGPPRLGSEPLSFLAALHGFSRAQMFEARLVLEVAVAGLAAERVTPEWLMTISDETTEMFAALDMPDAFLEHDIRFHQAVAAASDNPILGSLVEMVSKMFYEFRRKTIGTATDTRQAAEEHRIIYQAIRSRDAGRAREAMASHLRRAALTQALEDSGADAGSGQPDRQEENA